MKKDKQKPMINIREARGRVSLVSLCGVDLACDGPDPVSGQAVISSNLGRFEAASIVLERFRVLKNGADVTYTAGTDHLRLKSKWRSFHDTGVVSRIDTLTNISAEPVTINRCLARIPFSGGQYEVYSQQSRWCNENQGAWQTVRAGDIVLRCVSGRTTLGGTPYACVRETGGNTGLVFHVLPVGNWIIKIRVVPVMDACPMAVLELGLSDENLHMQLAPGAAITLPELLFQSFHGRDNHFAAPALQRHVLKRHLAEAKICAPVVYNTWLDEFEVLDKARLKRQVAAAKQVGCEVFVIDAGWYGAGASPWWAQAGDWREKRNAAFRGKMREFADHVRAQGLKFGLWMEPERIGPDAPVLKQRPEWFVPVPPSARVNLEHPGAYNWLRSEIGRLVETYELAWMKMDFNFDMDHDSSGAELSRYTALWYELLDEVRAAYPATFFEGCASGGLRSDISTLKHFDNMFPSDTVKPSAVLRISQGAYLRLPPGRMGRWAALRSAGPIVPRYALRTADSPPTVLVPGGGLWEPAESVGLNFAMLVALSGMFGFTGDLAGLPGRVRKELVAYVRFFKEWRRFLAWSVVHLLTPPEPVSETDGWVVFQFQDPATTSSLVFLYRLGTAPAIEKWRLRDLAPGCKYRVREGIGRTRSAVVKGGELMEDGLRVKLSSGGLSRHSCASVYCVERA